MTCHFWHCTPGTAFAFCPHLALHLLSLVCRCLWRWVYSASVVCAATSECSWSFGAVYSRSPTRTPQPPWEQLQTRFNAPQITRDTAPPLLKFSVIHPVTASQLRCAAPGKCGRWDCPWPFPQCGASQRPSPSHCPGEVWPGPEAPWPFSRCGDYLHTCLTGQGKCGRWDCPWPFSSSVCSACSAVSAGVNKTARLNTVGRENKVKSISFETPSEEEAEEKGGGSRARLHRWAGCKSARK